MTTVSGAGSPASPSPGRLMAAASPALAQSGEVNVYTYRETKLIQPLFEAFTKDTGIKVNVISASSGLEQRIKTEGANSPADVLLTVDIGRLEDAVRAGITQPIKSECSTRWCRRNTAIRKATGTASRCGRAWSTPRRSACKQTAITYEELADPKWKGKICIRSGQHIYNNALIAAYIAQARRGQGRGMAAGRQGEPRAEALGRRPRDRARRRGRQVRPRHRQHLLLGADERQGGRQEGVGRRDPRDPADLQGRRHPREPVGRRAGQACAQQGERHEADRMARRRDMRSTCMPT